MKWDLKSIKQCVEFVTLTYDVVFISVLGKYVWMIKPTDLSRGLYEGSIVGEAEAPLDRDLQKISPTETNRYWQQNKKKRKRRDEQTEDDEHDAHTRRSAHDGKITRQKTK